MPSASLVIDRVLTLLRDAPTRLAALTADLSPEEVEMRPTPDEWSASAGTRPSTGVCGRLEQLHQNDHRRGPASV